MILECVQCGNEFEVNAAEKSRYKEKGFDIPQRCAECRRNKNKTILAPLPKSNKYKKRHYHRKYDDRK